MCPNQNYSVYSASLLLHYDPAGISSYHYSKYFCLCLYTFTVRVFIDNYQLFSFVSQYFNVRDPCLRHAKFDKAALTSDFDDELPLHFILAVQFFVIFVKFPILGLMTQNATIIKCKLENRFSTDILLKKMLRLINL